MKTDQFRLLVGRVIRAPVHYGWFSLFTRKHGLLVHKAAVPFKPRKPNYGSPDGLCHS
jgi:hypothetical protein